MSAPETQNRTTETGSVIGAGFLLTKICVVPPRPARSEGISTITGNYDDGVGFTGKGIGLRRMLDARRRARRTTSARAHEVGHHGQS